MDGGQYVQTESHHVSLLIGPEADFTDSERELIKAHNARLFKLTSTVLRACQAATVSVALIKTLGLSKK
jgi:RsmE family RNA methyltransferase